MFSVPRLSELDERTGSTRQVPPWDRCGPVGPAANRYGWPRFWGAPAGHRAGGCRVPARIENLSGLPPAWIGVGGADLFVQEDIAYAGRLTAHAVATECSWRRGRSTPLIAIVPQATVVAEVYAGKEDALSPGFHPAGHLADGAMASGNRCRPHPAGPAARGEGCRTRFQAHSTHQQGGEDRAQNHAYRRCRRCFAQGPLSPAEPTRADAGEEQQQAGNGAVAALIKALIPVE